MTEKVFPFVESLILQLKALLKPIIHFLQMLFGEQQAQVRSAATAGGEGGTGCPFKLSLNTPAFHSCYTLAISKQAFTVRLIDFSRVIQIPKTKTYIYFIGRKTNGLITQAGSRKAPVHPDVVFRDGPEFTLLAARLNSET